MNIVVQYEASHLAFHESDQGMVVLGAGWSDNGCQSSICRGNEMNATVGSEISPLIGVAVPMVLSGDDVYHRLCVSQSLHK